MNSYSAGDCTAATLQGSFSVPLGCRPTGGMENGQVRAQSQKVMMSGANMVSTSYSASLDCTGASNSVELACGGVCVNGSTSDALPDGGYSYGGLCDGGFSEAGRTAAALISLLLLPIIVQ